MYSTTRKYSYQLTSVTAYWYPIFIRHTSSPRWYVVQRIILNKAIAYPIFRNVTQERGRGLRHWGCRNAICSSCELLMCKYVAKIVTARLSISLWLVSRHLSSSAGSWAIFGHTSCIYQGRSYFCHLNQLSRRRINGRAKPKIEKICPPFSNHYIVHIELADELSVRFNHEDPKND